jgi:hypothetical protein
MICIIPSPCLRRRKEETMNLGDVNPDSFITKKELLNYYAFWHRYCWACYSYPIRRILRFVTNLFLSVVQRGERWK